MADESGDSIVYDDGQAPSYLLRDLERPNWLPPASPEIIWTPDGIPNEGFRTMTMVGSDTNPYLLRSARIVDCYYQASIPEVMELIPNIERVPWSDDQRLPH
jgi:hypothetical protein